MNKLFLSILLCLTSLIAHCQSFVPPIDTSERTGFSLEPYVGYGTSKGVQNGSNLGGWRLGCGLIYMFANHFGVSSGIQVQQYSSGVNAGQDSEYIAKTPTNYSYEEYNSISANYKFTYLELPILVRYVSCKEQKVGVFAEAGFIVGCLIEARESGTINITNIDTSSGGFPNVASPGTEEEASKVSIGSIAPTATFFNLQGHLALGVISPLSERCSVIADISINKGFTNVGNSNSDYVNTPLLTPFYYYNKYSDFAVRDVSNYGTNFSFLLSFRLLIELGSK